MRPEALALAIVLLAAATAKLTVRSLGDVLDRVPVHGLIRRTPARLVFYCVALLEVSLATALLAGSYLRWGALATAAFFALGTSFTGWAFIARPGSNCGCFGSADPVTWRTPARAALMTGLAARLSLTTSGGQTQWLSALVACAALSGFWVLSPELRWKRVIGHARTLRYPRCIESKHSIEWAIERLHSSRVWALNVDRLTPTEPDDFWRESCWRMVSYEGVYPDADNVTYVFAIRLPPGPRIVRAAVVDGGGACLYAATERLPTPPWRRRSHVETFPQELTFDYQTASA